MKLSRFSLFLGAYIILSASFAQQAWLIWKNIFGLNTLLLFFAFLCLWILLAILYKEVKSGLNIKKILLFCVIYVLGFAFAWKQPFVPEKVHVLEYAFLAWLSLRDLYRGNREILKNILYTLFFVLVIGFLDEGFQKLLPWRVFEVRDIATNLVSGILGIVIFCITKK